MSGRPAASTIGQYDGDGRWTFLASPFWATSSDDFTRTTRPVSSSAYLRCQNSSRCETVGTVSKLWVGTGEAVIHSRLRASHGSGPTSTGLDLWERQLCRMFQPNTRKATAMMKAPTVATWFHSSKP